MTTRKIHHEVWCERNAKRGNPQESSGRQEDPGRLSSGLSHTASRSALASAPARSLEGSAGGSLVLVAP